MYSWFSRPFAACILQGSYDREAGCSGSCDQGGFLSVSGQEGLR